MKNCSILILTVLQFFFVSGSKALLVQKNILRVHFETVKLKHGTQSVVLNVTYKLQTTKPQNFHGFDCRFSYDQSRIRPTTTFFDGTASANAEYAHGSDVSGIGEYRIQVLSGNRLDTTNPVLFQVWYSIQNGFSDSAMIAPTLFDLGSQSGIDTVIIENTGRDQISWFPFGLIFIDTTKPPPSKKVILVTSDSAAIQSDSIKAISVLVSQLDSANLKKAIFAFDIDTAAFDSVSVLRGSLLLNRMLTTSRNANHVLVTVSDSNANITLKGSGELLKIVFRGRLRADTLCTTLLNAGITISNTDNLVASIAYGFKGICILGRHKKDTVTKEVRTDDWQSIAIKLTPNPASSFVNFQIPSEGSVKKHLVVSDGLGRIVLDKVLYSDFWWEVSSVPAGLYSATVFEDSLLKSSRSVKQSSKILIIH